jgi:hypothetical protein
MQNEDISKAGLSQDNPERWRMGELGYMGLSVFNGVTNDELKKELNFPNSIKTYKQMSYHSAINAAVSSYSNMLAKTTWQFNPPKDATEEEKKQAEIINSMFGDMQHTFGEFVSDVLSMNIYGFSVHEKVFRKRYKANGSKYNDGLIGWSKLPIRSQESIEKFLFDESGNSLRGVKQNLSTLGDPYGRYSARKEQEVILPISKVLLFRQGNHRGDPFGKSPLRQAYLSWRFLTVLEEIEAIGVNKDLTGIPVLRLPPQYLSADASPEQKAIRGFYENAVRNMQSGSQAGVILPQAFDPDTRQPLFDLSLLSTDGKRSFDIDKIKTYYQNSIYTSLGADGLILGQSSTGSFALASFKSSVMYSTANQMAKIIKEVLEQDLIKQTYELNGWDTSRMGTLDFDGLIESDTETFSKAVQRIGAVGMLPRNVDTINTILRTLSMDELPEDLDREELLDLLTPETTRSGDGMVSGLNSGTGSADGSSGNASDTNSDNTA